MNAFSNDSSSEEQVADMIMKTYNNQVNEEITGNDVKIEQSKKTSTTRPIVHMKIATTNCVPLLCRF
jgi:hypothetical protein